MVWDKETQELNLPVTNTFAGAKIFRVGEEVGTFEPSEVVEVEPITYHGDMLECTAEVPSDREERLLRFLRDNRTTGEHNETIGSLVKRYAQFFAVSEQELTQTTLVEYNIDTGDAIPIRQKARPVPLAVRVQLRRILHDLHERKIIEPSDDVFCYLDDIMVATKTVEKHFQVLEQVFQVLSKARLKLNPKKCVLLEMKVEFLGHIINHDGLHMDPAKVQAIRKYPLPQSRAELRTFLGMCSYYRKFVLGFSKVAAPLHEMTSEKTMFQWNPARKSCFDQLKTIIVHAPVLAQPDIEEARSGKRPFKIHTDASIQGLGAVLSQEKEDGFLHPVFFASKGLSRCERNYHVTDLEALAVVFALRKFHMIVYGLPVKVYTDHQPLTALFKCTNVSARVLRWALELQRYNLEIIYLKGAANRVADALSRGAIPSDEEENGCIPNELIVAAALEEPEWTTELRKDLTYAEIIASLESGNLDRDVAIPKLSQKLKVVDFVMDRGYLALLDQCSVRRVVPASKRKAVFEEAHSGLLAGHFGPKKMIRTLITMDHPLNLRRKCDCGLFDQMAHVALPTLKHPMARSKRVADMFQLANVASISEQECWGDERKEEELRMKNSQFMSPYGLALAMEAHRRRCHIYAEAIDAAQGMKFDHPALFPWPVKYDVGGHITTALAMLKHIKLPGTSAAIGQPVFLALPQGFARMHMEVDYDDAVTIYVYENWEFLAQKLLEVNIFTAIIVVWPGSMPSGRSMRQLLIALERHLQPGGTLLFFPSPYEDHNQQEWTAMGRVCAEFVRFMTTSDRGFEAVVRDHYSEVLDTAPYTHPAICLGTDPRFKETPFIGRQIVLYLEKMRITMSDILRLEEFKPASDQLKEKRREEQAAKRRRRRDEFKQNFFVIADPERRRQDLQFSFRRPSDSQYEEGGTSQEGRVALRWEEQVFHLHPYEAARGGASGGRHNRGNEGTRYPRGNHRQA
uniref:RNA-directed DNA polymerase n=1 Tax=Haemonchus contortus TaxID=6289 RepID=A0A7I4YV80_HAECO